MKYNFGIYVFKLDILIIENCCNFNTKQMLELFFHGVNQFNLLIRYPLQMLLILLLVCAYLDYCFCFCFCWHFASFFVPRSLVTIVIIDLPVGVNNLPVSRLFEWEKGLTLFLFAPNLLEDIHHPVEERSVHLEAEVVILVQSTSILQRVDSYCGMRVNRGETVETKRVRRRKSLQIK